MKGLYQTSDLKVPSTYNDKALWNHLVLLFMQQFKKKEKNGAILDSLKKILQILQIIGWLPLDFLTAVVAVFTVHSFKTPGTL